MSTPFRSSEESAHAEVLRLRRSLARYRWVFQRRAAATLIGIGVITVVGICMEAVVATALHGIWH